MSFDIYAPKTLYGVMERMAPAQTFLRDTFFRDVVTFASETVDFDMYKGGREMAPFVHPMGETPVRGNRGYTTKTYKPPLVAESRVTTAADLMTRSAGENPYSGKTPASRAVKKLADDMSSLDKSITRREEWMAAQVLFEGYIPVVGEGIQEVIDFDFTNQEAVTAESDKWTNPDAPMLDMVEEWYEKVQKNGYVNPNMMVVGRKNAQNIVNNKQMKELLDIKNYEIATIAPRQLMGGVTWIGRIGKLDLDIYQYNEWYTDYWTDPKNVTTMPLVPEKKIAMISTEAQFSRLYGMHTYVDADTKEWRSVVGERVPDSWVAKSPDRQMLSMSSHPLLVPHEVESWFVAETF